jgi:hypothetical protein
VTCQLIPTVRGAPCQNDDLVQQIPLGLKLGRWVKLWHYHTGGRTIQPLQSWHVVAMASEITGYFILFLWDSTVVHSTGFSFSGHNCYVSRAITRTWQTWQTWQSIPWSITRICPFPYAKHGGIFTYPMTDPNGAAIYGVPWIPSKDTPFMLAYIPAPRIRHGYGNPIFMAQWCS